MEKLIHLSFTVEYNSPTSVELCANSKIVFQEVILLYIVILVAAYRAGSNLIE